MSGNLYPHFSEEIIDHRVKCSAPTSLVAFSSNAKKRKCDDIVVATGDIGNESGVFLYRNPRNIEFDNGVTDEEDLSRWQRISIKALPNLTSFLVTDVSGNAFNDLIVTYSEVDGGNSLPNCIVWLENFGTDEGDWTLHEIGKLAGANSVKAGHFTNTYSLQLLALAKASSGSSKAPLTIFTRPPDVYKCRSWFVTTTTDVVISSVTDCVVVPGSRGQLDRLLISSAEGVTMVWYHESRWHQERLVFAGSEIVEPEQMSFMQIGGDSDSLGCLAIVEKHSLHFCEKCEPSVESAKASEKWESMLVAGFGEQSTIIGIQCHDFDRDGIDEIFLSVIGDQCGVFCFVVSETGLNKFKLSNDAFTSPTLGQFHSRGKVDLAWASLSPSSKLLVQSENYLSSPLKAAVKDRKLVIAIASGSSCFSETEVLNIAGFLVSICILPPNTTYHVALDATEAVKVLHGKLGWIDASSELIERTAVAASSGCVASMLVDCPEGVIRSGDEGSVFLKMRSSERADCDSFEAYNALPPYFPCDARDYTFNWSERDCKPSSVSSCQSELHLDGFQIYWDDPQQKGHLASISFRAADAGTRTRFTRNAQPEEETKVCVIRACLSSSSFNDAALIYCADDFGWTTTPPSPYQVSRARKLVIPVLAEHGPFWNVEDSGSGTEEPELNIAYPWHAWCAGSSQPEGKCSKAQNRTVWMVVEFPNVPDYAEDEEHRKLGSCLIC